MMELLLNLSSWSRARKVTVTFCGDAEVTDVRSRILLGSSPDPFDTGVLRGSEGRILRLLQLMLATSAMYMATKAEDGVGLQSITWDVVPEPSSAALGAIGMSMILLRRRKV